MRKSPRRFSEHDYPHQRVSGAIVAAAHVVHRALGFGFLEAVYKNALTVELRAMGFTVNRERRYDLTHRDELIGIYKADLVVESSVIAEVKTGLLPDPIAPTQTLNYLRASRIVVGLVIDFCPGLHIKRLVKRHSDPPAGVLTKLD